MTLKAVAQIRASVNTAMRGNSICGRARGRNPRRNVSTKFMSSSSRNERFLVFFLQQRSKLVRRHGLVEIKSLEFIAGVFAQQIGLLLRFYALSHDGETQGFAHGYDCVGQMAVRTADGEVPDKRSIDLDGVERKLLQRG